MGQKSSDQRHGVIVEYGPDEIGYVADSETELCVGFSRAQIIARQGELPALENGARVVYHLDETGRVDSMGLDLTSLAHGVEEHLDETPLDVWPY